MTAFQYFDPLDGRLHSATLDLSRWLLRDGTQPMLGPLWAEPELQLGRLTKTARTRILADGWVTLEDGSGPVANNGKLRVPAAWSLHSFGGALLDAAGSVISHGDAVNTTVQSFLAKAGVGAYFQWRWGGGGTPALDLRENGQLNWTGSTAFVISAQSQQFAAEGYSVTLAALGVGGTVTLRHQGAGQTLLVNSHTTPAWQTELVTDAATTGRSWGMCVGGEVLTFSGGVAEWLPPGALAAHATTHQPGGSDQMAVDAVAATGSLRTIGTGALQACAGNDGRLVSAVAAQSLWRSSAAGLPVELPIGSDGQVLTVSGGSPTWQASPTSFPIHTIETVPIAGVDQTDLDPYQNDGIFCTAFYAANDIRVTSMLCMCTQAGGSGRVYFAIYDASLNRVVQETSGALVTTTGLKVASITPTTLTRGLLYYAAIRSTGNGSRFGGQTCSSSTITPAPSFIDYNNTSFPAAVVIDTRPGRSAWVRLRDS